jgi:hypothetical protein
VHDPQLIKEVQAASRLQQQEAAESAARRQAKQQQQQQQPQWMLGRPPAPQDTSPLFAAAGRVKRLPPAPAAAAAAGAADGLADAAAAAGADDIISDEDDSPMETPCSRSCSMQPPAAEQQQQSTAATVSHGSELGASRILDCYLGPATYSCAAAASGAAVDVSVAVVRGLAPSGAAIIRPPGHHAEGGLAMGFCYFNNAAVAARAAQRVGGAERVLILDWDVHHGNGTAAIFEDDPTVMYMSLHRLVKLGLRAVLEGNLLHVETTSCSPQQWHCVPG